LLLALAVTGVVVVLFFPSFTASAATTIATDPWRSAALGVAMFVAAPVTAALLAITVLGLPLGVTLSPSMASRCFWVA
jgi:hypothetical protein